MTWILVDLREDSTVLVLENLKGVVWFGCVGKLLELQIHVFL